MHETCLKKKTQEKKFYNILNQNLQLSMDNVQINTVNTVPYEHM